MKEANIKKSNFFVLILQLISIRINPERKTGILISQRERLLNEKRTIKENKMKIKPIIFLICNPTVFLIQFLITSFCKMTIKNIINNKQKAKYLTKKVQKAP